MDSKNSIFDDFIFSEQPIAKEIDGANKIKFLLLDLCFKRAIFSHAFIFDASLNLAAVDALIEPVINGFWFYALHKVCAEVLGKITLTIVYTIGHIFIATMCAVIIFSATVNLAAIDAFVEPIINAFWFYFLHSFYGAYSQKREVSYE